MQGEFLFWFLAVFAAISVGLGKGGLPVIAGLAVPSLSLVMSPIAAAGLLLPVYVVSDVFALLAYRRNYEPKVLRVGVVGLTIGVLIGWATAHLVHEWVVTILIGLMGVLFSVHQMLKKFYKKKKLYFCQNHFPLMIMNIHFPMMIWLKCLNEKTFNNNIFWTIVEWECLCRNN